jgi:predicted neutral ceramidase superfamily lipid hydrolase
MFGDFWNNVGRYPRYFITVVLGVFLSAFGWLAPLLKRPVTAVALIGFLVGTIVFVSFTLKAMLGLTPMT